MQPIHVLIHGASGRMGDALLRLASVDAGLKVAAAVARRGPAQADPSLPWLPPDRMHEAPRCVVVLDFSLPDAFDAVLAFALERGIAFVSGTTGLTAAQERALERAAERIPVLWAANFSLGVAVLGDLAGRVAAALPGWDCDLIEAHHIHKRDAPSGTALALGRIVAGARGREPHYASLRAGDIVGEHTLQFSGAGERLELVHRATSREIFARGALECAKRIAAGRPGRYSVASLILD